MISFARCELSCVVCHIVCNIVNFKRKYSNFIISKMRMSVRLVMEGVNMFALIHLVCITVHVVKDINYQKPTKNYVKVNIEQINLGLFFF